MTLEVMKRIVIDASGAREVLLTETEVQEVLAMRVVGEAQAARNAILTQLQALDAQLPRFHENHVLEKNLTFSSYEQPVHEQKEALRKQLKELNNA